MALPLKAETNYYYLQPELYSFAQATRSKQAEEGSRIIYREIDGNKTPYHVFLYSSVVGALKSIKLEEREWQGKKFNQLQIVLQDLNDTYIISVSENSSYARSLAKFITGLSIGEIYTVKCWVTEKTKQYPYPTKGFSFYDSEGKKVEGTMAFEAKEERQHLLANMKSYLEDKKYEFSEVKKPQEGAKNYDNLMKSFLLYQGSVYSAYIEHAYEQMIVKYMELRKQKQALTPPPPTAKEVDITTMDDSDDLPF